MLVSSATGHVSQINASPDQLYALVADIEAMAKLSPECESCWWLDGATNATVGARFRGRGRHGRRRWTTTCEIVDATPGRRISWRVTYWTRPVACWTYEFSMGGAADEFTMVTVSYVDQRGFLLRRVSPLITGSRDRRARNSETVGVTLERLRSTAEASPRD